MNLLIRTSKKLTETNFFVFLLSLTSGTERKKQILFKESTRKKELIGKRKINEWREKGELYYHGES